MEEKEPIIIEKEPIIIRPYTDQQVTEHAAKCGGERNLREITIETEDNEQFVYLVKKPSRSVIDAITDAQYKKNINGVQKLMIACILEGDRQAYEHDGSIYARLLDEIGQLANTSKSEIKKI